MNRHRTAGYDDVSASSNTRSGTEIRRYRNTPNKSIRFMIVITTPVIRIRIARIGLYRVSNASTNVHAQSIASSGV